MLGIAVQLGHHFGSKCVIDSMNSHGFCSSYSEIQLFETSVAMSQGTDIPGLATGRFVQFVADNADHNGATLDGHNTFHGMGIIAAVTPGTKRRTAVARCSALAVVNGNLGPIAIHFERELQCTFAISVREIKLHPSQRPYMEDRSVVEVGVAAAFIKTGLVRHDAGRSPRHTSRQSIDNMLANDTHESTSHLGSSILLQRSGVFTSATVDGENVDMDPE